MKFTGLTVLLWALLASTSARSAHHIAPEPPDSELLKGHPVSDHADIYLSRRTIKELGEFYAANLGGPLESGYRETDSAIVLTHQQVAQVLSSRRQDPTAAPDLKVRMQARPPVAGSDECRGQPFRRLWALSRLQHREPELRSLCQQYGYLQNAYFQRVPDVAHPGHWLAANHVILDAREAQIERLLTRLSGRAEQSAQVLTGLTLDGRSDAASALATEFAPDAQNEARLVADWDAEVAVLKALDAKAFRTRVILPIHPDSW